LKQFSEYTAEKEEMVGKTHHKKRLYQSASAQMRTSSPVTRPAFACFSVTGKGLFVIFSRPIYLFYNANV
jgi:hypothetical protein